MVTNVHFECIAFCHAISDGLAMGVSLVAILTVSISFLIIENTL